MSVEAAAGRTWHERARAARHRVGGAAVGELTGDNLPDLVIAWTTDPNLIFLGMPVALLTRSHQVLVAHPSVNVRNVQELIALARARPEGLTYGSGGNGSSGHLCTELFCSLTGTRMVHVPYKGDGQAANDLLAGQIQLMFTAPNVAMANVKAGRLKLLAVTTRERVSSMPEVPTVHETLKDFEYLGWIIAFAPAATPRAVLDTLANTWNKARTTPALQRKLEDLAMNAPERFAQRVTGPFGLTTRPLPLAVDGSAIHQFWHARLHKDPGHQWLREWVAQCFGDSGKASAEPIA